MDAYGYNIIYLHVSVTCVSEGIPRGNTMSFSPTLTGSIGRNFAAPPTGVTAINPEQERDNLAALKTLSNTEVRVVLILLILHHYSVYYIF